ncbi:MAG: type II toxin-antitoxin system RelE/ParE family toxin [Chloroflexi bacterium]|nr:type II toxin-antitoxin system RelE/ParE family toxin [Chloroflexota bacterium]MYE38861.1 type II toxin-antitoxin system RelE/ParE family toxin [Chloroflexota bacterium]
MGQIRWSVEAQLCVDDIFQYIAGDNPQAALRTIRGIRQQVLPLADFPEMGHRYQDSERHVRILLHGHYQIPYLVYDNRDVLILGVYHTSMDISRLGL